MRIGRLFLLLSLVTGSAFSQVDSTAKVSISVRAANFTGSPVRIVSIKRAPELSYADLIVKNESNRSVMGVRFYLLFPKTKGCTYDGDYRYADTNSDTLEPLLYEPSLHLRPVNLGPNQQSSTITTLLSAFSLVGVLRETKESFVPILLALEMVRFDDGSLWERASPSTSEVVGYFEKDSETCKGFADMMPAPSDYIRSWDRSQLSATNFHYLDPDVGFSFICSVKDNLLLCPLK